MPKLKTLSGREVRGILEAHGFVLVAQKGSHMKMRLEDDDGNTIATVPVPDHKTIQPARFRASFARAVWGAALLKIDKRK